MDIVHIGMLIIGLIILITGGHFLVKGASNLALRLKISPLVVGLTIVAFGTSAPELFISISAALKGSSDITMGNVVGSNICNLAFVMGAVAIVAPIKVHEDSIKYDWPMTMGSSLLLFFFIQEQLIDTFEGIGFVVLLVAYVVFLITKSRREHKSAERLVTNVNEADPKKSSLFLDFLLLISGGFGLYFGSDWFVEGSITLAETLGVSERIIGLTIVALGTSLPELVTSIIASIKKESDLAIGNLLGSNIFNILSILGITSLIRNIEVSKTILRFDMLWMIGITFIIFPFMVTKREIERYEGIMLLGLYFTYNYLILS